MSQSGDPENIDTADANITSKTFVRINTAGNRREVRCTFVTTSTSADVVLPLSYIDDAEIECLDPTASGVDRQVVMYLNSNTTSGGDGHGNDIKGLGGQVHITAITSGLTYQNTARGA